MAEQQPFKLWVQGSIPCRLTGFSRQANDPSLILRKKNERNFPTPCPARKRRARLPHETASEGARKRDDNCNRKYIRPALARRVRSETVG